MVHLRHDERVARFLASVSMLDGSSTPADRQRFREILVDLGWDEASVGFNARDGILTARFWVLAEQGEQVRALARRVVTSALRQAGLPARVLMVGAARVRR
jgi:hypothetical protein